MVRSGFFGESLPFLILVLFSSFPLQFVFVESISNFVATPDDASVNILTCDDDVIGGTDEDNVDTLTICDDSESLVGDAVPLEPTLDVIPNDDE